MYTDDYNLRQTNEINVRKLDEIRHKYTRKLAELINIL